MTDGSPCWALVIDFGFGLMAKMCANEDIDKPVELFSVFILLFSGWTSVVDLFANRSTKNVLGCPSTLST